MCTTNTPSQDPFYYRVDECRHVHGETTAIYSCGEKVSRDAAVDEIAHEWLEHSRPCVALAAARHLPVASMAVSEARAACEAELRMVEKGELRFGPVVLGVDEPLERLRLAIVAPTERLRRLAPQETEARPFLHF